MSQNSLVLPTSGVISGLQMTQDTNNAIDTLNTLSSGTSAPSGPEAGQFWHDTTNNIIKLRSLDNTTWIPLFTLNEGAYLALPSYSSQITGDCNRIINAGMVIDQVNEGASYTVSTSNVFGYTVDQWEAVCLSGSAAGVTAQRVTDAPPGFTNSLKVTVGTGATSVGTTDYLALVQPIEANNISDLAFGGTSAAPVSLSFWVKSSVTGTFSVALGNTTGGNRQLVKTFTITSAGVWQQVTLTDIPGDQAGTWGAGSASGLNLFFTLASGSNYLTSTLGSWQGGYYLAASGQTNGVLTTSGATFQVTGVMLNAGAFSLPYEKRLVQKDLLLCERYYQKNIPQGVAVAQNAGGYGTAMFWSSVAGSFGLSIPFVTPMRVTPSVTTYNPAAANANWYDYTNSVSRAATVATISDKGAIVFGTGGAALAANNINYTASARM